MIHLVKKLIIHGFNINKHENPYKAWNIGKTVIFSILHKNMVIN